MSIQSHIINRLQTALIDRAKLITDKITKIEEKDQNVLNCGIFSEGKMVSE